MFGEGLKIDNLIYVLEKKGILNKNEISWINCCFRRLEDFENPKESNIKIIDVIKHIHLNDFNKIQEKYTKHNQGFINCKGSFDDNGICKICGFKVDREIFYKDLSDYFANQKLLENE